jgi:nucleoside-diphosphate-sugar epimerase
MIPPGKPATCLVTGASGFIGRHLCRRLQQDGSRVRALLRHEVEGPWDEFRVCTLGADSVPADALAGVETVYHLAGVVHARSGSGVDSSHYQTVNVLASEALARGALAAGVRQFIYFSSVKAAAEPGDECVDESWQQPPRDPYGQSKREAERRLLALARGTNMRVTVLRPALVYGAAVKGNLRLMLRAIDSGRFPPLPDSANRRSMVSVEDLVDAARLAAASAQAAGQVYIVSDDAPCSTRQLSDWMHAALGRRVPRWSIPLFVLRAGALLGDVVQAVSARPLPLNSDILHKLLGSACYRSDKLQRQLGWQPRVHVSDCLPAMVSAYREATIGE